MIRKCSSSSPCAPPLSITTHLSLPSYLVCSLFFPIFAEVIYQSTLPPPHLQFPTMQLPAAIIASHYVQPSLVPQVQGLNGEPCRVMGLNSRHMASEPRNINICMDAYYVCIYI